LDVVAHEGRELGRAVADRHGALVLQLLAHAGIGHRRDDRRVELVREKMAYDAQESFTRSALVFDAEKLVAEKLSAMGSPDPLTDHC
jgi:hypothetical protein